MFELVMLPTCFPDIAPTVKRTICPIITPFQFVCGQTLRFKNNVPRIVEVPIVMKDALFVFHALKESCPWIRSQDMICGCSETIVHSPVHCLLKNIFVVVVKPEYKTAIDHDAKRMQPGNGLFIVFPEVLFFITLCKIR